MAANVNSKNSRSRMKASSDRKHEYRGKGRLVKYWAHLGCWISPCYSPFSLGARSETYELFIPLIFKMFSGHGKPRKTETADNESMDTGERLYSIYHNPFTHPE
jgi:hypothetical protein